MALTLETALVLPLSLSLIFSILPASDRLYRATGREIRLARQENHLAVDPELLYALSPILLAEDGPPGILPATRSLNDSAPEEALLTSPKLMFSLVTAVIDSIRLLKAGAP